MTDTSFYRLRVADRREETASCISLALEVPAALREAFAYTAGQYLTLRATIDGEEVRRSYSLCSAPHEGEWRVAVKRVPEGRFSGYVHERLAVGDEVEAMPPQGHFRAPSTPVRHVVGFAAGSGITPVIGIAKQVLHEQPEALVTLFYGNRATPDIIFREALDGLKNAHLERLRVFHVLSREDLGTALFFGRMDAERCGAFAKTLFTPADVDHYYFCGPLPMVEAGRDVLRALGVPKDRLHYELFGAPVIAHAGPAPAVKTTRRADLSKVAITVDGRTVTIDVLDDGSHLLEAGLSFGLELPYACKGGVCSTCKCLVTQGEVVMDVNYALEEDEVAAGYVLSCQARPVSEAAAVDFDV